MSSELRILVIGDIIGRPGMRAVVSALSGMRRNYRADVVIVNAENADDGFGISPEIADQLFKSGADVLTSGNHVWHHEKIADVLSSARPVLRPANYPKGSPGSGVALLDVKGSKVAVVNLQGRKHMPAIDCPFRKFRELQKKELSKVNVVIIDFHAEATEEKEALAHMVDGKVSLLYGTHTHIQTADERILPKSTAYITDVGATGPRDSVIGFEPEVSIQRSVTLVPHKNAVVDAPATIQGVFLRVDPGSGAALGIERIQEVSLV
ncbi:TIGR00282 family metallophosphoesterase [Spirochaeta dissipatitropha]